MTQYEFIALVISGLSLCITLILAILLRFFEKRQTIIPLWSYVDKLHEIDSEDPNTDDVINAINSLELIAVCCEAGVVDAKIIKRVFKNQYMRIYDSIKECSNIAGKNNSGEELLKRNPAIFDFYGKLEREKNHKSLIKKFWEFFCFGR